MTVKDDILRRLETMKGLQFNAGFTKGSYGVNDNAAIEADAILGEVMKLVEGLEAQVELNRWHYPDKGKLPEIGEDDSYYERRDLLIFELKDEEEFRIGYFVDEEYDNWDETSYTVEGFVPVPEQYSVPYTGILTFTPAQVARWRYIQLKEEVTDD